MPAESAEPGLAALEGMTMWPKVYEANRALSVPLKRPKVKPRKMTPEQRAEALPFPTHPKACGCRACRDGLTR